MEEVYEQRQVETEVEIGRKQRGLCVECERNRGEGKVKKAGKEEDRRGSLEVKER